jgi:hypothetical protein
MKNRFWFAIVLAGAMAWALPLWLSAQQIPASAATIDLASGPITVGVGDQAAMCATNLGLTSVSVTIELINALTGVAVLQKTVALGTVGTSSGTPAPGFCLDSATSAIAIIGILVGRVVGVNPQPLPPHAIGLVASLQVFSATTSAAPLNGCYVPLVPLHPPTPI